VPATTVELKTQVRLRDSLASPGGPG